MNKLLTLLKWVAIFYGFKTMVGFVTFRWTTVENWDTMYGTNGVIAILLTIACINIENAEMVKKAPTKKSKLKRVLLILATLGVIIFIYKKRRELFT